MAASIMVVAGEASGDAHMAPCISQFRQKHPSYSWFGIGGDAMAEAGVTLLHHYKETNVMGFVEVLAHYPKIRRVFAQCVQALEEKKPELLVLVDYPGFNLRLAKKARQAGVRVLYFIAPKIWASRPQRLSVIQQSVDYMAVIFPFEVPLYQRAEVPTSYVGNPLKQRPLPYLSQEEAKKKLGITKVQTPVIGLLPGSRSSELRHIFPAQLAAAQKLLAQYPQAQFVLPLAKHLSLDTWAQELSTLPIQQVTTEQLPVAVQACDVAVVASGTATLEVALLRTPQVVVYKLPAISYAIARQMVTIEQVSLVNVVAEKEVAKELIQQDCTAENIATEVHTLLSDSVRCQTMLEEYAALDSALGETNTAEALATQLEKMVRR